MRFFAPLLSRFISPLFLPKRRVWYEITGTAEFDDASDTRANTIARTMLELPDLWAAEVRIENTAADLQNEVHNDLTTFKKKAAQSLGLTFGGDEGKEAKVELDAKNVDDAPLTEEQEAALHRLERYIKHLFSTFDRIEKEMQDDLTAVKDSTGWTALLTEYNDAVRGWLQSHEEWRDFLIDWGAIDMVIPPTLTPISDVVERKNVLDPMNLKTSLALEGIHQTDSEKKMAEKVLEGITDPEATSFTQWFTEYYQEDSNERVHAVIRRGQLQRLLDRGQWTRDAVEARKGKYDGRSEIAAAHMSWRMLSEDLHGKLDDTQGIPQQGVTDMSAYITHFTALGVAIDHFTGDVFPSLITQPAIDLPPDVQTRLGTAAKKQLSAFIASLETNKALLDTPDNVAKAKALVNTYAQGVNDLLGLGLQGADETKAKIDKKFAPDDPVVDANRLALRQLGMDTLNDKNIDEYKAEHPEMDDTWFAFIATLLKIFTGVTLYIKGRDIMGVALTGSEHERTMMVSYNLKLMHLMERYKGVSMDGMSDKLKEAISGMTHQFNSDSSIWSEYFKARDVKEVAVEFESLKKEEGKMELIEKLSKIRGRRSFTPTGGTKQTLNLTDDLIASKLNEFQTSGKYHGCKLVERNVNSTATKNRDGTLKVEAGNRLTLEQLMHWIKQELWKQEKNVKFGVPKGLIATDAEKAAANGVSSSAPAAVPSPAPSSTSAPAPVAAPAAATGPAATLSAASPSAPPAAPPPPANAPPVPPAAQAAAPAAGPGESAEKAAKSELMTIEQVHEQLAPALSVFRNTAFSLADRLRAGVTSVQIADRATQLVDSLQAVAESGQEQLNRQIADAKAQLPELREQLGGLVEEYNKLVQQWNTEHPSAKAIEVLDVQNLPEATPLGSTTVPVGSGVPEGIPEDVQRQLNNYYLEVQQIARKASLELQDNSRLAALYAEVSLLDQSLPTVSEFKKALEQLCDERGVQLPGRPLQSPSDITPQGGASPFVVREQSTGRFNSIFDPAERGSVIGSTHRPEPIPVRQPSREELKRQFPFALPRDKEVTPAPQPSNVSGLSTLSPDTVVPLGSQAPKATVQKPEAAEDPHSSFRQVLGPEDSVYDHLDTRQAIDTPLPPATVARVAEAFGTAKQEVTAPVASAPETASSAPTVAASAAPETVVTPPGTPTGGEIEYGDGTPELLRLKGVLTRAIDAKHLPAFQAKILKKTVGTCVSIIKFNVQPDNGNGHADRAYALRVPGSVANSRNDLRKVLQGMFDENKFIGNYINIYMKNNDVVAAGKTVLPDEDNYEGAVPQLITTVNTSPRDFTDDYERLFGSGSAGKDVPPAADARGKLVDAYGRRVEDVAASVKEKETSEEDLRKTTEAIQKIAQGMQEIKTILNGDGNPSQPVDKAATIRKIDAVTADIERLRQLDGSGTDAVNQKITALKNRGIPTLQTQKELLNKMIERETRAR